MLVWLSAWNKVQIVCILSGWCHCLPKPHHLLPHLNPDWFYLSRTGLPRLSWKRGHWTGIVVVVAAVDLHAFLCIHYAPLCGWFLWCVCVQMEFVHMVTWSSSQCAKSVLFDYWWLCLKFISEMAKKVAVSVQLWCDTPGWLSCEYADCIVWSGPCGVHSWQLI